MKHRPNTRKPEEAHRPLTDALGRSERVKTLVQESASELSSVNAAFKEELTNRDLPPRIEKALKQSEAIEDKVQEAAVELSVVSRVLQEEVGKQSTLDQQLAEATEEQEAAERAAFHDPLTDLPNRALFNDRAQHILAEAPRRGWTVTVMFVELDNFKRITDSCGHGVGDSALRAIAGRLKEHARANDTVCRHGDDEFLYLLITDQPNEQAIPLEADKLVRLIQTPFEATVGGITMSMTISTSIGIAIYPQDGNTVDTLVANAFTAMHVAKESNSGFSFS